MTTCGFSEGLQASRQDLEGGRSALERGLRRRARMSFRAHMGNGLKGVFEMSSRRRILEVHEYLS